MVNKKTSKKEEIIQTYQDPIVSIIKEMETYEIDNLEAEDFAVSPEKWENRKILFHFYRTLNKIHWDSMSHDYNHFKHHKLIHLLTPMGVSAITLTHTFSPTFLGYTQEAFSWKLDIKSTNMLEKLLDTYDTKKVAPLGISMNTNFLMFEPSKFDEKKTRLISLMQQEVNVLRLFRELYSNLKGANDNLANLSKETLLVTVLNLICFAIKDFEELSINRKENSLSQDKIIVSSIQKIFLSRIKVAAVYQKPYVRVMTPDGEFI